MAKVTVTTLSDGSGFKFSGRLLSNDARNLDLALRNVGFEVEKNEEEASISSEQMQEINSFYND